MANKKKTTEQFIAEAKEVWGDRWDYSKTEYVNTKTKITITCKKHGDFQQVPASHLAGREGCSLCSGGGKRTREQFILEAQEVWGDKYDYSKVNYAGSQKKVTITCRDHGDFQQTPAHHLKGSEGCKECEGRSKTTEEFIEEATEVWGDRWGYDLVQYINSYTNVTIICKEHGEFAQSPGDHLRGYVGCAHCNGRFLDTEEFIRRSKEVWGDRWDYSNTVYVNNRTPVILICKEHGEFTQSVVNHIVNKGVGCKECRSKRKGTEAFSLESASLWEDRWDYSEVEYLSREQPVTILCKTHGEFHQRPADHLRLRVGCQKCAHTGTSSGEMEVREFLSSIGVHSPSTYIKTSDGKRMEIDMLSSEHKIGVEYNGLYWHSDKFVDSRYHERKRVAANSVGIRLLQIWEDDWLYRRTIVEEHLRRVFGKSDQEKIPARRLRMEEIEKDEARPFLNAHHIQGLTSGSVYIGGYYNDTLVSIAAFRKRGDDYELVRYATSSIIQGGHSKLVSYFEKNYSYQNLITFADLTFSDGGLYRSTGWKEDKEIPPDYKYVVGATRKHKFGYRINRFKNDPTLEYREGLTERELAELNGLLRVYDAGKIRFIKPHPSVV